MKIFDRDMLVAQTFSLQVLHCRIVNCNGPSATGRERESEEKIIIINGDGRKSFM